MASNTLKRWTDAAAAADPVDTPASPFEEFAQPTAAPRAIRRLFSTAILSILIGFGFTFVSRLAASATFFLTSILSCSCVSNKASLFC